MTGKILRDSELCARDVDHVLDRHAERARMADRALGMTARTARNVEGEHAMPDAIRGGPATGVAATRNDDALRADGSGNVRDPRVVAHEKAAVSHRGCEHPQRRPAGEIDRVDALG